MKTMWNRHFVLCLAIQTLYMLSFNMVTPLIAQYVEVLGGSVSLAGIIAGMFSLLALAFRPFVGYWSDYVSKSAFLLVGQIVGAVAIAGYGVAAACGAVAALRVVHAFSLCVVTTLSAVIAVDFIPEQRVAEGVGYVGAGTMVGMSLGPGLGAIVSESVGFAPAFYFGAALVALSFLCTLALPFERASGRFERSRPKFSPKDVFDAQTLPFAGVVCAFAYCSGLTTSFLVSVGIQRGLGEIALFFFISSVGMMVLRPIAGKFTDKHGAMLITAISLASEALCMILLSLAHSMGIVVIAALSRTIGQGTGQAALQGEAIKRAPDERRSRASATFYVGVDVGQGLGAIAGGMIADAFGYAAAMASGSCALGIGLFVLATARRSMRP